MKKAAPEKTDGLQGTLILLVLRTASGQLAKETKDWRQMTSTIDRFLGSLSDVVAGDAR